MTPERKQEIKKSFGRYAKARKEQKDCNEPCIKNGKSDKFCQECADDLLAPLIESKINERDSSK